MSEKIDGVIGAGFGRTGTRSLWAALEDDLELGPVFHAIRMFDVEFWGSLPKLIDQLVSWVQIGAAKSNKEQRQRMLKRVLRRFNSTVDFPACAYFEDLMEMYPNRKVILTFRSSGEEWYKSAKSTSLQFIHSSPSKDLGIWSFLNLNPIGMFIHNVHQISWGHLFPDPGKDEVIKAYEEWIERVKQVVPSDRLLVYNIKEGWKPLVDALNRPMPHKPFPRVNDADELAADLETVRRIGYGTLVAYALVLLLLTLWLWRPTSKKVRRTKLE